MEISFSSVGRAVAYNARGRGIESHRGHCFFSEVKHALLTNKQTIENKNKTKERFVFVSIEACNNMYFRPILNTHVYADCTHISTITHLLPGFGK